MKTLPSGKMRELDRRTIQEYGIPGIVLMESAGSALTRETLRFAEKIPAPEFLILAGKGNNGGDAFITAGQLFERRFPVTLIMAARPDELTGDAAEAFEMLPQKLKEQIQFEFDPDLLHENTILIDGLLGTGCKGTPREPFASWIAGINNSNRPVIAIDIPSGLNADDGSAELCVTADLTVTMAAVKTGMLLAKGPNACGRIVVAEIGIPREYLKEADGDFRVFTRHDAAELLKREPFDTFKNRRGHLAVLGGSSSYPHAPFLTGEAALRTGAGLVSVYLPASVQIFCNPKKALILRFAEDRGAGWFRETAIPELENELKNWQAIAAGPGLSFHLETKPVLELLLRSGKPLVLDADALNLLAAEPDMIECKCGPVILTPHPGEMQRLQNAFGGDANGSRIEQALELAAICGCIVALKGSRTVVASPDGEYSINISGNGALSTAGSGDTLTGITGALLAQGLEPWDAARLAVFLHGLCGEILSPFGSRGVIADDLADAIPSALRRVLPVA